jgi:two-component system, OmpR family, KDP operon response regulator KdpE
MSKGAKILVVDDDQDLVHGLCIRLHANDYKVCGATGIPGAIEAAEQEKPDLVILDVTFPIGNGILLIPRLRAIESLQDVPVVIMTGKRPAFLREEAIAMGAQAFLQKPVDNDQLLALVATLLQRRDRRSDPPQAYVPGVN